MKTIILCIIVFFLSENIHGQKGTFLQNVSKLKGSNSLKAKAITAYHATKDPCWEGSGPVTKDCTDLKDPWGDDTFPTRPPADTSVRITAFYAFERDITEGNGGLILPENTVRDAWKKHPGFSLKAMRARLEIYNLKIDK